MRYIKKNSNANMNFEKSLVLNNTNYVTKVLKFETFS